MAIRRIFSICVLATVFAVGYVHQKVEITKAGYRLQESRKCLSELIGQNSRLLYSLAKLESPRSLLTTVDAANMKFANQRVVICNSTVAARVDSAKNESSGGFAGKIMDLFMSSAEAKPHN